MAKGLSFGAEFFSKTATSASAQEIEPEAPLRILVLANFSGAAGASSPTAKPIAIDRDNFDEIFARLAPHLSLADLAANGAAVELDFDELDQLHPDRLSSLIDDFPLAAPPRILPLPLGEGRGEGSQRASIPGAANASPPISDRDLLSNLLDDPSSGGSLTAAGLTPTKSEFDEALADISRRHRLDSESPAQLRAAEAALTDEAARLRLVLHHPDFQRLEATWRALDWLVHGADDDRVKISIVDWSKDELAADLEAAANLRETRLFQLLCDQPSGAPTWSLVIGDYSFAATQPDVEMLGRIAQIAARANSPFIAAAEISVFGCPSAASLADPDDWSAPESATAAMWRQLRCLPAASSLGLVAPRFLVRLPYGADTSPTERLKFEELPTVHHAGYLWGNSAYLVAALVARTFAETGWRMQGRLYRDVEDLPLHTYQVADESLIQPSAESALLDRAVDQILDFGIMPIQAFSDRGAARLVRLQSLAEPTAPLSARWNE